MDNLEVALDLAARGFYVFPCRGDGPEDNLKKPCPGIGWRGVSTTDPRQIKMFWHRFPTAVPGIDMDRSGLITVDCDRKHSDGQAWVISLGVNIESVPGSITPSGGRHLIYRNPNGLTNGRGNLPSKEIADIDIRGKGGFIIGPGACFADGRCYQPCGSLDDIVELPPVFADYLTAKRPERPLNGDGTEFYFTVQPPQPNDYRIHQWAQAGLDRILHNIAQMPPGNRQDPIAREAWKAGQLCRGISVEEIVSRIENVVRGWSDLKPGYLGPKGTVRRQVLDGALHPRSPDDRERPATNGHDAETGEVIEEDFATPYVWADPEKIPRRQWLYGTLLVRKFVSMTVAPGGVGKSSLLTTEALAQVSGEGLLGIYPPRRMRVWLWNLEDPYEEITRKVQATAKHYNLHREDLEGRLFVNSGRDRSLVIAKTIGNVTTVVPDLVERLVAEIRRLAIDILVIDPFVSCNEASENDNSGQDKVIKAWARIAEEGDCAVHLVDHASKIKDGSKVTANSNRGASAKVDGSRVVRVINPMSADQAIKAGVDEPRRYFQAYNDKANLALTTEGHWYRLESVNLRNGIPAIVAGIDMTDGDSVGVVTAWEWPADTDPTAGVDFAAIKAALAGGEWRESPQASAWVGRPIGKVVGADTKDPVLRQRITRMIHQWVTEDKMEVYSGTDLRRKKVNFIRVK